MVKCNALPAILKYCNFYKEAKNYPSNKNFIRFYPLLAIE